FRSRGDGRDGVAAARAENELGRDALVLAWPARLRGRAEEAEAWGLAAAARHRRRETALEEEAHRTAASLFVAHGQFAQAARASYRLFYSCWEASEYRCAFAAARDAGERAARGGDTEMARTALEGLFAALFDIGDLDGARDTLARLRTLPAAQPSAR